METINLYALISGVSSGFGKAAAIELAKNGYKIYSMHLDLGEGKPRGELAEEISGMPVH